MAAPIPREPSVTNATLSVSVFGLVFFAVAFRGLYRTVILRRSPRIPPFAIYESVEILHFVQNDIPNNIVIATQSPCGLFEKY
jgi:hypothetical protein